MAVVAACSDGAENTLAPDWKPRAHEHRLANPGSDPHVRRARLTNKRMDTTALMLWFAWRIGTC
jgi:hypothetical protein